MTLSVKQNSIAFSWTGMPQYAARQIRRAMEKLNENCTVIGSKARVPIKGVEEALGQSVNWVDANNKASWDELNLETPSIFFQSGWSSPAFTSLGRQVKKAGGKVIGMSDANWRGDFRQLVLGPIVFRAVHQKNFDAMIVPGQEGIKLMKYFGFAKEQIHEGLYGGDPNIFHGGPPLTERDKTILYVGQFIDRKNVLGLTSAFLRFADNNPGWKLHLCGSGDQRDLIPIDERIIVEDFVQPEQLASRYQSARYFILPSFKEAWGLVVHEATMCGCGLILSDKIGSAADLATPENSFRFNAGDEKDLLRALNGVASVTDNQLAKVEVVSRKLGQKFGPDIYADVVYDLVKEIRTLN